MGCIYQATNKINGKKYVGKTLLLIEDRRRQHEETARRGGLWVFHCALRKYGFDSFEWEVLFETEKVELLDRFEIDFIDELGTKIPNGYNMTDGGGGTLGCSWRWNLKSRIKLSLLAKNRSPEARKNMSLAQKRRSVETQDKINKAVRKAINKPEVKRRMSEAKKGKSYEEIYGIEGAEKKRKKQSKATSGKTWEEIYGKEAAALRRENMSKMFKGKSKSSEHRIRISETLKKWFRKQAVERGLNDKK